MMKQCSQKFPLNCLSCLFYILKPEDATIQSLFYTLRFKVVQYLWILDYRFFNIL